MTGRVIRDPVRVRGADVVHSESVDQKLAQLEDAWRDRFDVPREGWVAGCERRIGVADRPDARRGGTDDDLCVAEDPDEPPRKPSRFIVIARVEMELSTAGLCRRKLDLVTKALEDSNGRDPRLRRERVGQASDEE